MEELDPKIPPFSLELGNPAFGLLSSFWTGGREPCFFHLLGFVLGVAGGNLKGGRDASLFFPAFGVSGGGVTSSLFGGKFKRLKMLWRLLCPGDLAKNFIMELPLSGGRGGVCCILDGRGVSLTHSTCFFL